MPLSVSFLLANELVVKRGVGVFARDEAIKRSLKAHDLKAFASRYSLDIGVLNAMVSDLADNKGIGSIR